MHLYYISQLTKSEGISQLPGWVGLVITALSLPCFYCRYVRERLSGHRGGSGSERVTEVSGKEEKKKRNLERAHRHIHEHEEKFLENLLLQWLRSHCLKTRVFSLHKLLRTTGQGYLWGGGSMWYSHQIHVCRWYLRWWRPTANYIPWIQIYFDSSVHGW